MENPLWLAVVAPAYNEEESIVKVVSEWLQILREAEKPFEIIIVNDGSDDQTGSLLKEMQGENSELNVVEYTPNQGYGYALSQGIQAARAEYIMTIDSDGQFDVAAYKTLFETMNKADTDFVTGYRMKKKDSFLKVLADRTLNRIVRILFRLPLRDTNCAQKIGKREILQAIKIEAMGYPTPTELTVKAHVFGHKIAEVGVPHMEREAGKSKIKFVKTGVKFLIFLFYLRTKIFLYKAKIIQSP